MNALDWSRWPNFKPEEFRCRHTGGLVMRPEFLDILQAIRTEYGKPMRVTSGYRHPSHPAEAGKSRSGEHSYGTAADIACEGADAVLLLRIALKHGITRIGVQQTGSGRFLHLGIGAPGLPNPTIWSY